LWQKACSGSDKVPLPTIVKSLATSLNIDVEKEKPEICSELRSLAGIDFSKLSDLEFERQKEKLKLSLPLKERLEKKPKVSCKNVSEINPLLYTDNTLAFYTDKNNDSWCFTASDFEEIIRNPVNPITNEELPMKVVQHMMNKLAIFKNTGINPTFLKPYGESLKDLYKKDTISNIKTAEAINTVINLGTTRGILEARFRAIPYAKMIYILDYIKMSQDYMQILPADFQFAVFCKVVLLYFKKNPETLDDILEIIKY
jgi:phage pi2 protein 07